MVEVFNYLIGFMKNVNEGHYLCYYRVVSTGLELGSSDPYIKESTVLF